MLSASSGNRSAAVNLGVIKFVFWLSYLSIFLQLPAGLFHLYLGKFVYIKDFFALVAVTISLIIPLSRNALVVKNAPLFGCLLLYVFVFSYDLIVNDAGLSAMLALKWVPLWMVAYFTGYWAKIVAPKHIKISLIFLLIYVFSELIVGSTEILKQEYFFKYESFETKTVLGLDTARSNSLDGLIRVRGLQRTVFQFSNNMAIFAVVSASLIFLMKKKSCKILCFILFVSAVWCCFYSGGRTGLLGVCFGLFGLTAVKIAILRKNIFHVLAWSSLTASTVSLIGPAKVFAITQGWLGQGGDIQMESSFLRQEYWSEVWGKMFQSNSWLFFGSAFSQSCIASKTTVAILDNQFLWFLYHFGIIGSLFLFSMFSWSVLKFTRERRYVGGPVVFMIVPLLCLMLGESIGRDSIFLNSSLVVFVLMGCSMVKGQKMHL